ncbi:hypothetical protein A9Q81_09075 [Gammaproteobacteria bacterium 42_54_T18]|nr:hypothetical protein A9Q81_09075 [Gammaproteobacteria bacterium 42_54_T18]
MTNTQPSVRYDRWSVYSLYAFAVLAFGGSLFAAGFLPPWDPTWDANKIAELYQTKGFGIQIGMMMLMLGCALYLPFCAITSELIEKRLGMPLMAKIQFSSGIAAVAFGMMAVAAWGIAAFRPERDPQITQLMNDMGWIVFFWDIAFFQLQGAAVMFATFFYKGPNPVWPRWMGYMFVVGALGVFPAYGVIMFKTGWLAYNGLIGYWFQVIAFGLMLLPWSWYCLVALKDDEPML